MAAGGAVCGRAGRRRGGLAGAAAASPPTPGRSGR